MNVNALTDWVDDLQGSGRYSFLRSEAAAAADYLSQNAVNKSLQRLAGRKRIAKVRENFFVIVPTEYRSAGAPPATWFIAELMQSFNQPYYVGLLSAAALHGASHQTPQEFQVITSVSQRPVRVSRQRIRFFTRRAIEKTAIMEIKSPTGPIHVSSPEATALDLVRFSSVSGHLDNVATVLSELADRLVPEKLLAAAEREPHLPPVQRLGYLLDLVGAGDPARPLISLIARSKPRFVPLRADQSGGDAPRDLRWRVMVNTQVQAEA